MPAALTMDPPNNVVPESSGNLPADEREHRARQADRERREAALTLASGDHVLAPGGCCPRCGGPTVIGRTVRTVHTVSCPRRAALVRARKTAAAGAPLRRPAPTTVPAPHKVESAPSPHAAEQPKASVRHVNRHQAVRARAVEPQPARPERPTRPRIRPQVVQAWRVTGTRITVDGWPATVISEIRIIGGVPSVRLDFDDYDTWTREDQAEIPDWWDLADLARSQHALAA